VHHTCGARHQPLSWKNQQAALICPICPAENELLVWIIRTAAAGHLDRRPAADHGGPQADHHGTSFRFAPVQARDGGPWSLHEAGSGLVPGGADSPLPVPGMADAGRAGGPGRNTADQADQMADQPSGSQEPVTAVSPDGGINAAAVIAYRASLQAGRPLSERKLAGQFGKTSRRWARSRMAEARQSPALTGSASLASSGSQNEA
jgi:hypothetical protein